MKIAIRTQYAIQAVFELALQFGSGALQIKDIARKQKAPVRFLEQILLILKREGIVSSSRGINGGYVLKQHPADISLLRVIEAMEGPIELSSKKMKVLPVLWEAISKIEEHFKKNLKDLTIEDMVFRKRQKDRAVVYDI